MEDSLIKENMYIHSFVFLLCIALFTCFASADSYEVSVSGPDGIITVNDVTFEEIICENSGENLVEYDYMGDLYSGFPLYRLLEEVDEESLLGPGYFVTLEAGDRYIVEIPYQKVAGRDDYILASRFNGESLPQYIDGLYEGHRTPSMPLMLVDPAFPSYHETIGNIESITAEKRDEWTLLVKTTNEDQSIDNNQFEAMLLENGIKSDDFDGLVFFGLPLYKVLKVSGEIPDECTIKVTGEDGYSAEIAYSEISGNNDYILASRLNGEPLPQYIDGLYEGHRTPSMPLMLVDPNFPSFDETVGNVGEISVITE